jgi:hypothetical protein
MQQEQIKMKKILILTTLAFILITGQSFAADYYVDKNHATASDDVI